MLHTMYLFLQLRTVIRKEETSTHTFLPQIHAVQILILVMCMWRVCVCAVPSRSGAWTPSPTPWSQSYKQKSAQHGCSEQNSGLQKQQALSTAEPCLNKTNQYLNQKEFSMKIMDLIFRCWFLFIFRILVFEGKLLAIYLFFLKDQRFPPKPFQACLQHRYSKLTLCWDISGYEIIKL